MSDPDSLATLNVLVKVVPPALHTNTNFLSLAVCRMVNVSLERGNGDGSGFAYVWLGMLAGPLFNDYRAGFRFGRLGYELVERRELGRFKAATYMCFGSHVLPWTQHIRTGRQLVRDAFEVANRTGDLTFATYCCENLNRNLLSAGDPLADVQREAETGLAFAQRVGFDHVAAQIVGQLALVRTLRGLTPSFGRFDEEGFEEEAFERHLAGNLSFQLPECWYWIKKVQARCSTSIRRTSARRSATGTSAMSIAVRNIWASSGASDTLRPMTTEVCARGYWTMVSSLRGRHRLSRMARRANPESHPISLGQHRRITEQPAAVGSNERPQRLLLL